ncbi:arylsulfatase [Microbacterium kribbense]|uniref:Arylsulfatase n=1 Tax=Microbacterium kribbense TaxID=433645 RepID=A0ABP7GAE8_9MICO
MAADGSAIPAGARGYEGFAGQIGDTFAQSTPSWPAPPAAPDGAPNVIVMVIDDMGWSDLGPFGSEIPTPTIDSLAARGVVATNYHSAPVCSPARAALLTGINPHRAGYATVAGADPGFPGYTLQLPEDVHTMPEILQANGYATFAVGKWHLASEHTLHEGGTKQSWPVQRGFDHYYGCLEGYTTFFAPNALTRDNSTVEVDRYPDDYYLTNDLTDQAISMIRDLRASDERKPFFLYFAHNAMHGPLGARRSDIEKHRGKYADGWDAVRRARFERQRASGVIAADTEMVDRNVEPGFDVQPWAELSDEQRGLAQRHMEVYAAMVDNIDQNLARLLDAVDDYGQLDNTIVMVVSDNGGTSEGGADGTRSYFSQFINGLPLPDDWDRDRPLDPELIGGPQAMIHYPRGWAQASNTPFRLYKMTPYEGGIRVPCIISWPAGLPRQAADDGIRGQYLYATDVLPTLLAAIGVEAPTTRNGLPTRDIDGVSALEVLRSRDAAPVRAQQYTEFSGNRAYSDGRFKIVSLHPRGAAALDDGSFRLFDMRADPAEVHDLAAQQPEVVARLAAEWRDAAWHNTVFPIALTPGDVFAPRRPGTERLQQAVTIFPGTPTLERFRSLELIALRDVDIDLDVDYAPGDEGVLVAHGDQGGGYVAYVEDGNLVLEYNEYGIMHRMATPVPCPGRRTTRISAHCRPGYRWEWSIIADLDAATKPVVMEQVMIMAGMAPFTGIDVGIDRRGPVSWSMHERHGSFRYTGRLRSVRYLPGARGDFDPSELRGAERAAARVFD